VGAPRAKCPRSERGYTLTLVLLRDSRDGKALLHTIRAHYSEFEAVYRSPGGREAFEALKAVPGAGDVVMTYAEELRVEGKTEGKVVATRQMVLRLLGRKFPALPAELRARVERASEAECIVWADRLLDATSLNDIFVD